MKFTNILTAAALALAMVTPAAQATTVNATVSPAGISVGDAFTIELETDAATTDFIGFQAPLSWDGTALNLTAISYNASFDTTSPLPGTGPFSSPLNVAASSFNDTLSNAQTLAIFTFEALAAGSTVVTFETTEFDGGILTGTDGGALFDSPVVASVSIDAASTDPNVVPLPASLLLLLGGLLGLPALRFARCRV